MSPSKAWRWKSRDLPPPEFPGLLYEPGNWGDVLKDAWVLETVRAIADDVDDGPLRVLDPWAGRPAYSLTEATARRLELVGEAPVVALIAKELDAGRFPSTATCAALAAASRDTRAELAVFDAEPSFRVDWSAVDGATVLEVDDGLEALAGGAARRAHLVLVDPYDLFDNWKRPLERSLRLARRAAALLYLYNKSPRGEGHAQYYRAFRNALASGLKPAAGEVASAIGRVPADAVLPRAWHEVVLVAPAQLVESLAPALRSVTAELAATIGAAGVFEDGSAPASV